MPFSLEEFLPYQVAHASALINQSLAKVYEKRFNITQAQWRVMAHLFESDGITAAELGEKSVMDKSMVSRAVADLVDRQYVAKTRSQTDKRAFMLLLTPQGKAVFEDMAEEVTQWQKTLFTDEQKTALLALLNDVKTQVKRD